MSKPLQISRRRFMARATAGAGVLSASLAASGGQQQPQGSEGATANEQRLKVKELDEFLRSLDPQARGPNSPDGLICGDLEAEIRAVGTTWMASMQVLEDAAARGINLIVTHEPTFWYHGTPRRPELKACEQYQVDVSFKTRFVAEHGITVLRAHNCWDLYPKHGIEAALQTALGLPDPVHYFGGYHHLYEVPKTNLQELARHCKEKMGLASVRVSGDLAKPVQRVVMAYGSSSSTAAYYRFWKQGADAVISGEQSEWAVIRPAIDMGIGVIELGHSNTEAFGMQSMAQLLKGHFPGVRIEYLPTGDSFQYV